ncbi:MAG: lactate dehydrogenase [Candidatus Latescibacteria bacterium]|nr:lactate dehydrogenase [Candidatus Latescibacterota bacterium]
MPNVQFFTSLPPDTARLLTDQAPPDYQVGTHSIDLPDADKAPLVQEADFLLLFPGRLSETVLRQAQKAKLLQLVSAGFDQINLDLLRELDLPMANNGGANAIDVAEHTFSLILGYYRRLIEMDRNVRTDRYSAIDSGSTTHTIAGKKVGIIGLGHIGREVGQRLKVFGAELYYADAFAAAPQVEAELGITRLELDDLLTRVDIVTLHVPLNEATRGLIGAEQLARMQSHALLVNTCRGPVVDESALTQALQQGQIGGAALDVLEQEPPAPDNPLLRLDNVLLTPHTAGVTRDTWARRGVFIFENFRRVWAGEKPLAQITA